MQPVIPDLVSERSEAESVGNPSSDSDDAGDDDDYTKPDRRDTVAMELPA